MQKTYKINSSRKGEEIEMPSREPIQILSRMENKERKGVIQLARLVSDELGKSLILELASKHSPIFADEVKAGIFSRGESLMRLYDFEKEKAVEGKMVLKGNKLVRKFHITDEGRNLASSLRS